ncbi:DNA-directed RNA polymerase subunit [Plakobranchus ocellatus]|uniref:DNA-directed RNA polymerase subunit n=1 Tax=Plakobranchus ocellatus TaxID=259542 RepID=A0AAV3ZY32_9GAST|nr:DNA-directed RNA polymerase subunit [Plakobranchus ocellatus]
MEGKEPSLEENVTPSEDFFACDVMGSGPEAAESDNSWGKCMKHPGHANFIPISEFCLESLPKQYQSQNTVDVVKAIADLTVKLVVRHNTADRMTYSMFCYSMSGDTSGVHVGSGWVMDIEENDSPCPSCSDCTPSSPPYSPSITSCGPSTPLCVPNPSSSLCAPSTPPCDQSSSPFAPITPSCGPSTPPCNQSSQPFAPITPSCGPSTPPCNQSSPPFAPITPSCGPSTPLCVPSPSSPLCAPSIPPCNQSSPPFTPITPSSALSTPPTMVQEPLKVKEKWFDIYVASASHVVFNNDEAQATEVQIFYDDKKSRKDKRMKSLYGIRVAQASSPDDSCIVVCRTHNASLATELKVCLERMRNMVVKKNHEDTVVPPEEFLPSNYGNELCIMISHPHGQPKMITLGQASEVFYLPLTTKLGRESQRRRMLKKALHYDTKSCPGSSGAPVFMATCIETRQKSSNPFKFVDALVIRPHSIGNVFGPPKSIGFSAGALPLQYFPLSCLPGS